MTHRLRLAALALALSAPLAAQEKKDDGKQKAAAVANLKRADLAKATVVETDNFLIASNLPTEKAKALGALLEKVAPVARKGLQFEDKEEAWKGKLAVYFLPESRDFKGFVRNVIGEKPDGVHYALRSDDPFVIDPVGLPGKPSEADQFSNTAAVVATAYLKGKASTAAVPEWLADGFGRVTAMRAEGTSGKRYTTYKAAAKAAVAGTKTGKPAALADLWAETKQPNADVLAASLAEYLAYGSGKEYFPKLITGFRPNENGTVPTTAQAIESAGWKDPAALEAAWKKWVQTGK